MDIRTVFVLFVCIKVSTAASWSYTGPQGVNNWNTVYPNWCGGDKQSPIDIKKDDSEYDSDIGKFTFDNPSSSVGQGYLKNNGHSVAFYPPNGSNIQLTGGGLDGTYKFYQFHFHWGADSKKGSEHTVNSKAYPLEVHIIFTNSKYSDVMKALNNTDGLAVLGIFFEIGAANSIITDLQKEFPSVVNANTNKTFNFQHDLDDMLPASPENFYRYSGSLTTPKCGEVVTWTVFEKVLTVSEAQMAEFRKLKDNNGTSLVDNFRPVQPLKGRKVKNTFSGAAVTKVSFISLSGFLISFVFIMNQ